MSELAARTLPHGLDGSAAQLAGALYRAYRYSEWENISELVHPYGRFLPLTSDVDVVLDRDGLIALVAGTQAPDPGLGHVEVTQFSAEAVLCVAQTHRNDGGSVRDAAGASIVTVKDGLLFRERAFGSAPDAYRGYLRSGLTLGL